MVETVKKKVRTKVDFDFARTGCDAPCPLADQWSNLRHPRMTMCGNTKDADILVVGEAPGKNEDNEGLIFIGQSGHVIRQEIPSQFLDRLAFQNTVRCRPPENRTPTPIEVRCCSTYLDADAESLPIKAVLGAGNVPLQALWGPVADPKNGPRILRCHGVRFPIRLGGRVCWYYPVFHPSFVMRADQEGGGKVRPVFENDLKRFFREVDNWDDPVIHDLSPDKVIIPATREEAESIVARMADPLAVDLETNCLHPYKFGAKILTASFSDGKITISFSVEHEAAPNPWGLSFLLNIVRRRRWIAHNANFEMSWFRFFSPGDAFINFEDTMAMSRLYHQRETLLNLEMMSVIHLGTNVKAVLRVSAKKLSTYTLEQILQYNGLDTMATALIYHQLKNKIDKSNYRRLLQSIDTCVGMELAGLPICLETAHKLKDEWTQKSAKQVEDIKDMQEVVAYARDKGVQFNIASARQLAVLLDTYTNVELPLTAKGNLSTAKGTLAKVAETNPLARAVLDYREAEKLASTYIDHVLEVPSIYPDRMLHPAYTVLLTATGRLSSTNPNCFPPEVEVLTSQGWKCWDSVRADDHLAQYDLHTGTIDFTRPLRLIDQPFAGQLVRLHTKLHFDVLCTRNHGFYTRSQYFPDYRRVSAEELPNDDQIPQAGYYSGSDNLRPTQVTLIAAFQADAEYREKTEKSIIWEFAYQRKQDRLRAALLGEQIPFKESPCRPEKGPNYRKFFVTRKDVPDWLADKKHYGPWLLDYDQTTLQLFADEVWLWDGSSTTSNDFCTGNDQDADWVQILLTLTGRAATKRQRASTTSGTKFITARRYSYCCTNNHVKDDVDYSGHVYCATMPKDTLIVRYNGRSTVVSNSQNFPRRRNGHVRNMIRVPKGFVFLAFDYAQLEARVLAMASKDRVLCESVINGRDIHADWRENLLHLYPDFIYKVMELHNLDDTADEKTLLKAARDRVKNMFVFASFYGSSASSCAELMGLPLGIIEELAIMFWEEFKGVKKWLKARRAEYQQTAIMRTLTNRLRYQALYKFNEPINCIDYETEVLSQRGWLNGHDVEPDDILLTANSTTQTLEWQTATAMHRYPDYSGKVYHFTGRGFSAVTTPQHRWACRSKTNLFFERTSETLSTWESIPRVFPYANTTQSDLPDDWIRLIGWSLTDSTYENGLRVVLFQKKLTTASEIDELVTRLGVGKERKMSAAGQRSWVLDKATSDWLIARFPNRMLEPALLIQLADHQLQILFETMVAADGSIEENGRVSFCAGERRKQQIDNFQMLSILCGRPTTISYGHSRGNQKLYESMSNIVCPSNYWTARQVRRRNISMGWVNRKIIHEQRGMWCPTVPNGFIVVRREGAVYITGQSPIQGTAADIVAEAMNDMAMLSRQYNDPHLHPRLQVHDDLSFIVPEAEVERYIETIHPVLTKVRFDWQIVPLGVEAKIGYAWGDLEEFAVFKGDYNR